jgi:type IV pilus assembly protein PilC
MPKFIFTANTKDGSKKTGVIEATTRSDVIAALSRQNLKPISIEQSGIKGSGAQGGLFGKLRSGSKKVKIKDLVIFSRQMATMISAGVPLTRSLATMQEQTSNKYFKTVVNEITKDVEGGMSLGDSFGKFPNVFSEVYVNMVRAGEAGGILDDIMKRLAEQVEQESSMRKKIKGAMTYPIAIMSITVLAFFGITVFVLPKIGAILKDIGGPDAKLPIYTRALLGVSDIMRQYAVLVIIVTVVSFILIRRYIKTPKGKYKLHSLLLRIPVLKDIIIKVAIARFARTFASLMSSGVSVLNALEVTGGAIGNKVIEKELQNAAKEVKNGKQLSETLASSPHFPSIVSQMLSIGEETGQTDVILVKVADFYEEEVATVIDSLSSIIEPVMIVFLGGGVGLIAASVMGPIANLSKSVTN